MKWLFLLTLFLGACTLEADCDEKIRELYPHSRIEGFNVRPQVMVYRIDGKQYVLCYSDALSPQINSHKFMPWTEMFCGRMTHKKRCLERYREEKVE